jgi:hypothetical protein
LKLDIEVHIEGGGTLGISKREGWPLDVFAHVRVEAVRPPYR